MVHLDFDNERIVKDKIYKVDDVFKVHWVSDLDVEDVKILAVYVHEVYFGMEDFMVTLVVSVVASVNTTDAVNKDHYGVCNYEIDFKENSKKE